MGVRLNAVMSILGDKRPNPWKVVAIKHVVLCAAHDHTVELHDLFAAKFTAAATKVREGQV